MRGNFGLRFASGSVYKERFEDIYSTLIETRQ
jgi:hypothetical protein